MSTYVLNGKCPKCQCDVLIIQCVIDGILCIDHGICENCMKIFVLSQEPITKMLQKGLIKEDKTKSWMV